MTEEKFEVCAVVTRVHERSVRTDKIRVRPHTGHGTSIVLISKLLWLCLHRLLVDAMRWLLDVADDTAIYQPYLSLDVDTSINSSLQFSYCREQDELFLFCCCPRGSGVRILFTGISIPS